MTRGTNPGRNTPKNIWFWLEILGGLLFAGSILGFFATMQSWRGWAFAWLASPYIYAGGVGLAALIAGHIRRNNGKGGDS